MTPVEDGRSASVDVRKRGTLGGVLAAQPSKNYLTRYLWTSGLIGGTSELSPVLPSEDAHAMLKCLKALGAEVRGGSLESGSLIINGFGTNPLATILNPDNAGAVLRFLLSVSALNGPMRFETDRMDSLGARPNIDLVRALEGWGVRFDPSHNEQATLPLETLALDPDNLSAETTVSGDVSSQYLSSLLLVAPLFGERLGRDVVINVSGDLKSRAAVETTLDVMEERGCPVQVAPDFRRFVVAPGEYRAGKCRVPGDWPGSAAILCAAAAVPGSEITLTGLRADRQGERHIVKALREMGCEIDEAANGDTTLRAPDVLKPLRNFNGDLMTDAIPPLMAVLALADGTSRIENVENLRYKECNRITDPLGELRKLGVESHEELAAFEIDGRPDGFEGGIRVHGFKDHRVIMLLTIAGLRCRRPIEIDTAEHIAKSYPEFFDHMRRLGAEIDLTDEA